jgi:predicted amidohydrolase
MSEPYLAAAIQMTSTEANADNLEVALQQIDEAASRGARLVALPEMFTCLGSPAAMVASAEPIPGPTSQVLSATAKRHGIWLLAGSLAEASPDGAKVYNTSILYRDDGEILSIYRKLHRFDIDLPGRVTMRESDWTLPGNGFAATTTEIGVLGQAICYDLRFDYLFNALAAAGSELLLVPSAFTSQTGRDHWEILLRARAIEHQCYVVAPNQFGRHGPGQHSYGRSMIIDPWGIPLATAPDGTGVIIARIDPAHQARIREHLPQRQHRIQLPLDRNATS